MTDPTPKPRWFHPTPDRFVIGLLVVECLLWLSEKFQWFRFNTYEGWTVLIAVATVGIVGLLMLIWFTGSLLFRLQFQFTIRSLLGLTVVVALPCSWLAIERERARKQKVAVDTVYSCHGSVDWDPQPVSWGPSPSEPAWLRILLGDEFFRFESCVRFNYNSDTDAGLVSLRDLSQLQELCLTETKITDAGMEHLKELTQLQTLYLEETQITDAGLANLKGLTNLRTLALGGTRVTAEGVRKLQQALPTCKIIR